MPATAVGRRRSLRSDQEQLGPREADNTAIPVDIVVSIEDCNETGHDDHGSVLSSSKTSSGILESASGSDVAADCGSVSSEGYQKEDQDSVIEMQRSDRGSVIDDFDQQSVQSLQLEEQSVQSLLNEQSESEGRPSKNLDIRSGSGGKSAGYIQTGGLFPDIKGGRSRQIKSRPAYGRLQREKRVEPEPPTTSATFVQLETLTAGQVFVSAAYFSICDVVS